MTRFLPLTGRQSAAFFTATSAFFAGAVAFAPTAARAQTGLLNERSAQFASREGNIAFLALGVGLPFLRDGDERKRHGLRTLDTLATSSLLTVGLKAVVREKRPDGSDRQSFPSGHASAAFAIAAMQSRYHPKEALLWYAGAFFIADSRVTLRRHYSHDVIAGAALGIGTAYGEVSTPRGLVLSPFISPNPRGKGMTVGFNGTF